MMSPEEQANGALHLFASDPRYEDYNEIQHLLELAINPHCLFGMVEPDCTGMNGQNEIARLDISEQERQNLIETLLGTQILFHAVITLPDDL